MGFAQSALTALAASSAASIPFPFPTVTTFPASLFPPPLGRPLTPFPSCTSLAQCCKLFLSPAGGGFLFTCSSSRPAAPSMSSQGHDRWPIGIIPISMNSSALPVSAKHERAECLYLPCLTADSPKSEMPTARHNREPPIVLGSAYWALPVKMAARLAVMSSAKGCC